ncbi:uncharacterized protein LOC119381937 [Rhipicephalus sanguineus]|uniref:uncharacterized protein LOC119381937 n=1 Tax=Rhipicephalus sanguineus TaxID=34632 RepID=UPI0020C3171E|nr:uncharacterized protein LOC119381937 [Rhipicephalus sanguineus]
MLLVEGERESLGLYLVAAPLSLISAFTPNISSEIWLSYLNELLSPYRFQSNDKVLVHDIGLPRAMGELFAQFSNEDLLYTLGWWFAQQYIVIASPDGGLASYGSAALAQANRPIDCYAITESRFRRELFHERAQASLGSAGLRQAVRLLANIRNTTVAMVRSVPWLDEEAHNEAALIARKTRLEPWRSEFGFRTAGLPSKLPTSIEDGKAKTTSQELGHLFTTAAPRNTDVFQPNR